MLVEFENVIFNGGIFLQSGAKNYFGIKKNSYFGNYMDPRSVYVAQLLCFMFNALLKVITRV